MRRLAILIALAPLSACNLTPPATVSETVSLNAEKAFLTAQTAFAASQSIAIAGIKSGVISGTRKTQILDLLARGAAYEAMGYNGDVTVVRNLTDIVAALSALGVKGN